MKLLAVDDLPKDVKLEDEVRLERVVYSDDNRQKVAELTFTEQVSLYFYRFQFYWVRLNNKIFNKIVFRQSSWATFSWQSVQSHAIRWPTKSCNRFWTS